MAELLKDAKKMIEIITAVNENTKKMIETLGKLEKALNKNSGRR